MVYCTEACQWSGSIPSSASNAMQPYATLDSTYTRVLRLSLVSVDVDLLETGPHTADEGGALDFQPFWRIKQSFSF